MKICSKCKRIYFSDNYCKICGSKLINGDNAIKILALNKSILLGVVFLFLLIIVLSIIAFKSSNEITQKRQEIEDYKYEKAINEYISTPTISDLQINTGWKFYKERNYYYVEGTVTNLSYSKNIRYYKIQAKFYDKNGNMIDSDWTNGSDLGTRETQKFKMMYKYDSRITNVELSVKEVS